MGKHEKLGDSSNKRVEERKNSVIRASELDKIYPHFSIWISPNRSIDN